MKEFFKNLPDTTTPLNAQRLNGFLNGNEAMGDIVVSDIKCKNYFNMNNLTIPNAISFENGVIAVNTYANGSLQNLKEIAPDLKAGETYMLNFKTTGSTKNIYLDGSKSVWFMGQQHTITQEELDSYIIVYGEWESSETVYISEIQIEKSLEPTEYTSYKGFGYESGSNENGSWIKYDDGTMICMNTISVDSMEITTAWGSGFRSNTFNFDNFPQPFISKPYYANIVFDGSEDGMSGEIMKMTPATTTNVGAYHLFRPMSATISNFYISYFAVGRWK